MTGRLWWKKQNKTNYQLKLTLARIFLVPRPSKWFLLQRKALLLCTEVQGQTVKELWPGMNKWRSIPKGSEVLPGEQRGRGEMRDSSLLRAHGVSPLLHPQPFPSFPSLLAPTPIHFPSAGYSAHFFFPSQFQLHLPHGGLSPFFLWLSFSREFLVKFRLNSQKVALKYILIDFTLSHLFLRRHRKEMGKELNIQIRERWKCFLLLQGSLLGSYCFLFFAFVLHG